jgi:predicted RNA-binding protein with PIN domain
MSGPSKELMAALRPHLGPVRHALHGMDPNELPPGLRKVAAYAGGRLPPPLLKRLITELDGNEWLRGKVGEEAGDHLDEVAAAFILRAEGWWMVIAGAAAAATAAEPAVDLRPEVERLEAKLGEAKRRIAELRSEKRAANDALKSARKGLKAQADHVEALHVVDALRREIAELEVALETERNERAGAEQRLDDVKRRRQKRAVRSSGQGKARAVGMRDPVATARRLDLQAAALAAAVRGEPGAAEADLPTAVRDSWELVLPAGIAPDGPEAVEWLVGVAAAVPVIVDGYNLTYLMNPDRFTTPETRKQLVADLERFLRHARSAHRIVLVFDSSEGGEPEPSLTAGGVAVFFATTADTADDEIVERVRSLGGRAVVFTNDRELRERVDEEGALALWGSAFVHWAAA